MLTILRLLQERDDCIVIDKHLDWNTAVLSAYADEIEYYRNDNIYGIELKADIPVPHLYHSIDHHGSFENNQSSLEQVATVLGVKLNRFQELVAANDKGYIPAMKALGASEKEIKDIREKDRAAQGITPEDERLAEHSIKNHLYHRGDLLVVKSETPHFSAICDRLYPYNSLLVYNDSKWTIYGAAKERAMKFAENGIKDGKVYYGGGSNGFVGSVDKVYSSDKIMRFVKKIIVSYEYSYHNFMFPFRWRCKSDDELFSEQISLKNNGKKKKGHKMADELFSEQISLKNIEYVDSPNWTRVINPDNDIEKDDLYNERNYFYKFVHNALYDNGSDKSLVRHFERKEVNSGKVTYVITCGEQKYELVVSAINLNLYSTGVGVLSFYLHNYNYASPKDVLKINQVGRRVFPPFIGCVRDNDKDRGIIADCIEIKGLHGTASDYKEDFSRYTKEPESNCPATFIQQLIKEVAGNKSFEPVVDDRMFVECWYKNDEWANRFNKRNYNYEIFVNSSDWYEYVFVDDWGGLSCQNTTMQKELISKATYERWQKYSSLYGISRYSMVYLTSSSCPDFLLNYFETIYARMAELVLVQKASVLRFSAEVTNLSDMTKPDELGKRVSSLYKEYIRFVNQIHFREVSSQDQGIEMYQMLYDALNIGVHVEKLDNEIGELFNYVSMKEDREINNTMSQLTWITIIGLPVTVVAGLFGMNNVGLAGDSEGTLSAWYNFGLYQFIVAVIASILVTTGILIYKKKDKIKDKMKTFRRQ